MILRVLIIDHDAECRKLIKSAAEKGDFDIEFVGEVSTISEAEDFISTLRPDIIIAGICGGIEGLEFIKALTESGYGGAIIILSEQRNFEYIKRAYDYGARAFVLKPLVPDEICQKISMVRQRELLLKEAREIVALVPDIQKLRNFAIRDLFSGFYASENEIRDGFVSLRLPVIESGALIYCRTSLTNHERLTEFMEQTANSLNETELVCCLEPKGFVILTKLAKVSLIKQLIGIAVNEYEKRYNVLINIGVATFMGLSEISRAYKESVSYIDNSIFAALSESENSQGVYKKTVVDALKLIAENYSKEITVKWMADRLYVSESHLMHIFKNDMGKTFNNYLTQFRINVAKRLIENHNYKICEIAEMVGFKDPKYFGQVFKKETGSTPSEYIKNHK